MARIRRAETQVIKDVTNVENGATFRTSVEGRKEIEKTGQPLKVFRDLDFAGCLVNRKSRSEYVFTFAGGAISWLSKKQLIISQSTCEAEFVAMQGGSKGDCVDILTVKKVGSIVILSPPMQNFL